jgi:hypothetical protein
MWKKWEGIVIATDEPFCVLTVRWVVEQEERSSCQPSKEASRKFTGEETQGTSPPSQRGPWTGKQGPDRLLSCCGGKRESEG